MTKQRRGDKRSGDVALERMYRGHRGRGPGLLFLDFEGVICTSVPYGRYELFSIDQRPADLYERLWHAPAAKALLSVVAEHKPRVVITTDWLRFMERDEFEALFRRTGLSPIADALHDAWEAPEMRDMTRYGAIERWLRVNYAGEPLVILDGTLSGTGLKGSKLDKLGCVVWCETGMGLHGGHLQQVRRALLGV